MELKCPHYTGYYNVVENNDSHCVSKGFDLRDNMVVVKLHSKLSGKPLALLS